MGAQYKPAEVERLISESREDDARLPAVPWRIDPPESAQVAAGETVVADCWVSHPSDAIDPSINERSNASAIARIRNNLRAMADQLEAARAEVGRLRELNGVLAKQSRDLDTMMADKVDDLAGWCRYALDNWAPGGSGKAEAMEKSLVGTIGERKP